ncbi:helix-turn-helix domain-containing protein [Parafrigoribacterium humi]|uniref:helix-turn-helix domain-containing protein n=1 Tax=Parafrigoribacterium humi TaxID=3144664 RepID=UPI0032EB23CB
MSKKPSEGLGKRLARFRKLADLSARELAEMAGYGLTRGVIANIETGRKTDITVDQLIALSAALAIPPVVLAMPIDEPYRFVRLANGKNHVHTRRVFSAMDWFNNMSTIFTNHPSQFDHANQATAVAENLIRHLRDYMMQENRVTRLAALVEAGTVDQDALDEANGELEQLRTSLSQLQVDLQVFKVDDSDG